MAAFKPSQKPRKKAFGIVFYLFILCCAVGVGAGSEWIGRSGIVRGFFLGEIIPVLRKDPQQVFGSNHVTLLVLGCDEDRAYGGRKILRKNARSDMMLVARLDFENMRIGGISIPRDLAVAVPGYQTLKINAYHSIGGKDLAKRAAETVLGVSIDRVMVIDYGAFQELVNLVGGVEIYVPKRMKFTDRRGDLYINLKAGRQRLDGYQAMGFVRFRHSDSDLHRMQRQRDFMLAMRDSAMKHLSSLPAIADKAKMVMGNELSDEEMSVLARFVREVGTDSIKMGAVPVLEGRGSNLVLDTSSLRKALEENYITPLPVSRVSFR